MFDFDLAELYEVETRTLNQAVKRNEDLFPSDFKFRLSQDEWLAMSSQFVMTYPAKRPKKAMPYAFTEHGVAMLANVLKSKKARQTSVAIVRAFIALKQYSLHYEKLAKKIAQLEEKYQRQFKDVIEAINYLMNKETQEQEQQKRKRIGF
jgi:hypothetical protein